MGVTWSHSENAPVGALMIHISQKAQAPVFFTETSYSEAQALPNSNPAPLFF